MDIKKFGKVQLEGSSFSKEDLANILVYYANAGQVSMFGNGVNMFIATFDSEGKMTEKFNNSAEFYDMVERREKKFQKLLNRCR